MQHIPEYLKHFVSIKTIARISTQRNCLNNARKLSFLHTKCDTSAQSNHRSIQMKDYKLLINTTGYNDFSGRSNKESGSKKISWFKNGFLGTLAFTNISVYNESNKDQRKLPSELTRAVFMGDEKLVRKLLMKLPKDIVNTRHELGWLLLHIAAINGHASICELLLKHGASIDEVDEYTTPYDLARKINLDPGVVALLREVEFSSNLSGANFKGCTALHYAALSNNLATIQVLMKHNANPDIVNELGFKAVNFADSHLAQHLTKYKDDYGERLKLIEAEEKRRYPLEQRIKEHIIGQEAAISMVAATIRRKENGWFDKQHPLVFLFLGSSGIGKTELAKQVANYIHKDNKHGFIRLDMSEYQEKHSVARMVGSPPGYVGHDEGGQLTNTLRKCNNAVVLLDEVEKAHPDVLTILLQLFDEGRLTDGKGKTIDCKDAIFIMTSNLASEAIAQHAIELRKEQIELKKSQISSLKISKNPSEESNPKETVTISRKFKDTIVRKVLKSHFKRDEFLGRINEMVYFLPFTDHELRLLVCKELNFWKTQAKERNSIELTWDEQVIDVICKGYDIHYGARSIKHEVERRIINLISETQNSRPHLKKVHICVSCDDNSNNLINLKTT